jgi:Raf kinase inhibitor-like YbhB/YbcL family protein
VRYAFGTFDADTHVTLSDNLSPGFYWSGLPEGTQSLVMICHDPDVPSVGDDVNQEGREVPADLPRVDFYHWVLVDIDAEADELPNNYTDWFASDADMQGDYYGYDGPCPPWNDALLHRYVFTLYAIDTDRAPVAGRFDGPEVLRAISGHVLGQVHMTGTYTLNPALR